MKLKKDNLFFVSSRIILIFAVLKVHYFRYLDLQT